MKTTLLLTAFLVGFILQPAYGANENTKVKWDQPAPENSFRKAIYSGKDREVPVSISPVPSLKTEKKEWPLKKVIPGRPSENTKEKKSREKISPWICATGSDVF